VRSPRRSAKILLTFAKKYSSSQGPAGAAAAVDLSLKELVETQGKEIEALTDSLETTTSLLQGVTQEQLTTAVEAGAKLNGIITGELNSAIATIPKVTALCTRTTALTNQTNSLPSPLAAFACP